MPKVSVPRNRDTYSGLQRGRQTRQGHHQEEEEKEGLDPWGHCPPHCSVIPPPPQWWNWGTQGRHCFQDAGRPGGPRASLASSAACGSPGSDLCTRPSSASEASRAANCRHLCSRVPCCRRSRAVLRRSGRSISHSGLSGHRAHSPEPPPHPPTSAWSHLLFPEQPGRCHVRVVH